MWSKLEGSMIWNEAKASYAFPAGRHYHDFDHVLRLYDIAAERGMTHTMALDLAILAHDVIYDDQPHKEHRSAEWLIKHATYFDREVVRHAVRLILTTVRHRPGGDDRLALLDLYEFSDFQRSLANRELLVREFRELAGIDRATFLKGNVEFLHALAKDIADRLNAADPGDRADWIAVMRGIKALAEHEPVEKKCAA